jgi:hypothetical protein
MKVRIFVVSVLILLFSVATSFALVDQDKIVGDIAKSIREHPEQWIDTGSRFVHCEDSDKIKRLRKEAWPEHESNLVIIYNFYSTFFYAHLDKPFEYDFECKKLKELMQEIKLYKLRVLQKEVGNLLKRKEVPKKKLEKKEIIEESGLKKL